MSVPPAVRRSWRRRVAIGIALAALALGGAIALLPHFVDSQTVRRVVERRISALANGEVRYDALALRFFPQPRVVIQGATVSIPGVVDARAAVLDVELALRPLLTGDVRPTAIRIEGPAFKVRLAPGGAGGGDPFAGYRAAVGPVVAALVRDAGGMALEITGGRLDLANPERHLVSLSGLSVRADVSAGAVEASVSSAADLWRAAEARVTIAAESLAASGKLHVNGLQAGRLVDPMLADTGVGFRGATLDAAVDVETDGRSTVRTALTASTPQLAVARGTRTLEVGMFRVTADATRDAQAMTVVVRALQLGDLLPQATASLRARPDGTAPVLEAQVPALDLARLRAAAVTFAGDLDAVRAAAAALEAGTARGISVSVAGGDPAALAELQGVRAEAQLEAGALALPWARIRIRDGAGRFVFADGALRGSALAGRVGKSAFADGVLAVELAPAASLRHLAGAVDAELTETLALARELLGRPGAAALADVESLRGRAAGRIAYEARARSPHFAVEATKLTAVARYRGFPFPVDVGQGRLSYSGDRLRVSGLAATIGQSRVQAGAADVTLGRHPAVRGASGDLVLVLDELYPWLASLERLRPALKDLASVTGTAAVRLARLSGPLSEPAGLDFEAVVRPQEISARVTELPAPLALAGGETTITPSTLRLDRLQAALLDARVTASGTVQHYASSEPRVDLALADGVAGQQALDWVRTRWQVPSKAMPRAPFSLTAGRLRRPAEAPGSVAAQGTVGLAEKVDAEFDFTWRPDDLDLRRLTLKDADSDATIALKWAPAHADLAFRGRLDNRTLERLLAPPPEVQGSLRGNFRASIDLRAPRRSTADGTLEGEGLDVLERFDLPVLVDRVRLDVAGDAVRIRDGVVRVAGERLAVTGTVERKAEVFAIDGRVTAERLDAARLLDAMPREHGSDGEKWNLPVEGRVVLDAKSVAYQEHVFQPVLATVSLAPNQVVAAADNVQFCGVTLSIKATYALRTLTVNGRGRARDQRVEQAAECLARENIAITGRFDLDTEFSANGPPATLLDAAHGSVRIVARDGRMLKAPTITRILFLNSVATLLRSGPEEMMKGGLEYGEITFTAALEGTRALVESVTLDSPSLGIAGNGTIDLAARRLAMNGLVAPFANINAVARRIPIIGRLFDTRVLGIPVSVTGDWRDPTVIPLGPEAVGQSLVNLMSATFRAPIQLLDPFLGRTAPASPAPRSSP
jgi:hypothetical protein